MYYNKFIKSTPVEIRRRFLINTLPINLAKKRMISVAPECDTDVDRSLRKTPFYHSQYGGGGGGGGQNNILLTIIITIYYYFTTKKE
jgi:hypothetical protein